MIRYLKNKRGSIALVSALAVTALMGFAALVTDAGILFFNRMELSNMADAAVMAGAQDLPDTSQALQTGRLYAQRNGNATDQIYFTISGNNRIISADATRKVPTAFAKLFNIYSADVHAHAAAAIQPIAAYTGVVPLGVVKQDFVYGTTYTLKVGGGDGTTGNYGALALGGKGGRNYRDNLLYGYDSRINAGDWLYTETGNMAGPTKDGVNYRVEQDPYATYDTVQSNSVRIIVLPVLDSFDVNGRGEVLVVGFASFFLEGATGSGTQCTVQGKFMRTYVPEGETSDSGTGYGLYGVRLIQ